MPIDELNLLDCLYSDAPLVLDSSSTLLFRQAIHDETKPAYDVGIPLREYLAYRDVVKLDETKLRWNLAGSNLSFPNTIKLTRELGRLCGIFYTYGAVDESSRVYIFSDMKDNLMDEFKEIVYKLSSSAKLIPVHELHDSFFEIDDAYVRYLLSDVLCHKRYVYEYHIPGWYFNTNNEFLKGFIDVVSGTEGDVELCLFNRDFIEDFRLLLKKFNIDSTVEFALEGKLETYIKKKWILRYKLDWTKEKDETTEDK